MGSTSVTLLNEVCLSENRGLRLLLSKDMSASTSALADGSNQARRKDLRQFDPHGLETPGGKEEDCEILSLRVPGRILRADAQSFRLVPELRDVKLLWLDGYVIVTIVPRPVLYGQLQY